MWIKSCTEYCCKPSLGARQVKALYFSILYIYIYIYVCVCVFFFFRRNSNSQMNQILWISCTKNINGSGVHSASQEPSGFRNQMTWCKRNARGVQKVRLTLQGLILHYLIVNPNAKNHDVTFREWSTSSSIKNCTTLQEFCKQHFNRLRTSVNCTHHQLQHFNFVQPVHTYVPYYSQWEQH